MQYHLEVSPVKLQQVVCSLKSVEYSEASSMEVIHLSKEFLVGRNERTYGAIKIWTAQEWFYRMSSMFPDYLRNTGW